MWTRGLGPWYVANGRHHLPWRQTRDPWAVLVSEVMLQQTQVARVIPRWQAFLDRWPAATACAAAPRDDLLRFWKGLGYPRRALALQRTAALVATEGWPRDEAGLRALPGIGRYTARALLTLAFELPCAPSIDLNVRRVAARAALGLEPEQASDATLESALRRARPGGMRPRDFTLALFDVGALHCRAVPRCTGCPLQPRCRAASSRSSLTALRRRRQPPYGPSVRRLRGALLAELLDHPDLDDAELERRVAHLPAAATSGAVAAALAGLAADGLIDPRGRPRS